MALTATALCRFLCLENPIIPLILFDFEQIHSFFIHNEDLHARLLYSNPDGYIYISVVLGGRSVRALQTKLFVLWTWRPFKLEKEFALKSLSPRHCLRAQLPSCGCREAAECCPDAVLDNTATTCSHWRNFL